MKKRTNTAFWVEKEKRWCIAVQKNGTRKRFYSSTPGRTGQREANAKADAWLDDSIRDGRKKVAALYAEWVEELKLTCGTSYVIQCNKYGEYYILPVCGNIRIDELTEGDLQKAIDMSFKKRCLKKGGKRTSDKPLSRSINRMDEETTGKNENAIRSFDMGKEAREAYEAQVALLKASGIPLNYTTPLFQIPNQRALFKRWKKYQKDNGIEPQVTLYEMRHTFVSIESGVLTDSQLKMLVGHSKNMDTAGVYRHELDGQREDLAAATTAAFRKAQG